MLYVFTDRIGADTMLAQWMAGSEMVTIEYFDGGGWTAMKLKIEKEGGWSMLLPGDELRYAPR